MSSLIKIFNKSKLNTKIYVENFNIVYTLILSSTKEQLEYQDNKGKSIIHYVCSKKIYENFQKELLYVLLNKNIDINQQDYSGKTALHYAVYFKYFSLVKILISIGKADINIQDLKGHSMLHINYSYNSSINKKDREDISKYLIENGCDVNLRDINGETVLFNVMCQTYYLPQDYNSEEIIKSDNLLDYAEKFNTDNKILDLILEQKCDINIKNTDGESAFVSSILYCTHSNHWRRYLYKMLKANYDIHQVTANNNNIINHIIDRKCAILNNNDYLVIKLLIKENIDYKLISIDNYTILHQLFSLPNQPYTEEFYNLAYFLIDNGVDINKQNDLGNTPLHCFFENNIKYRNIVYILNNYNFNRQELEIYENNRRNKVVEFILVLIEKYSDIIDLLIVNQEQQTFFQRAKTYNYDKKEKLKKYTMAKFNNLLITEIDKKAIIDLAIIKNICKFVY